MRGPMEKCQIVDDSRVIRKVARKIMEELQFGVDEAEDGVNALQKLRADRFDFVVSEWSMSTPAKMSWIFPTP